MTYSMTSNEAAKLLKKLNEELESIRKKEGKTKEFNAAIGEDPASVRPKYDYAATQEAIEGCETKIMKLKHQLNQFNVATEVPGFGITVDQALVLIPMLSKRKAKLGLMAEKLPKTRVNEGYGRGSSIIDYVYLNYDAEQAAADLEKVSDKLSELQTALDLVNNTVKFKIEL